MIRHRRRLAQGFTLIEMLISITIGLFILIAIGVVFISAGQTARQREDQIELNEPARVGLGMMRTLIAQAGYLDLFGLGDLPKGSVGVQASWLLNAAVPDSANVFIRGVRPAKLEPPLTQFFPSLQPVFGCVGSMNSSPNALAVSATPVTQSCGTTNPLQQTLQLAFQVVPYSPPAPGGADDVYRSLVAADAAVGNGRDCLQQTLPTTTRPGATIAINRFFIKNTDGVNELHCEGSGAAGSQPVVRGVQELVFRYQLANTPVGSVAAAGGAPSRFMTATEVSASALGWAAVTSVEVCMVSATENLGGRAAQGTTLLQITRPTCGRQANGTFNTDSARAAGDAKYWRRFVSVVAIRNAIYRSPS